MKKIESGKMGKIKQKTISHYYLPCGIFYSKEEAHVVINHIPASIRHSRNHQDKRTKEKHSNNSVVDVFSSPLSVASSHIIEKTPSQVTHVTIHTNKYIHTP